MPKNLLGGASFAHLLGRPAAAKRAEEDEKDRRDEDGDRGEGGKAKGAKRAEDDEGDDSKKKDARAEDDDRKDRDDDKDRDAKAKSRRASDDEDDEDDEADAKAMAARRRERARCSAIFASPHAAVRPDVAAQLAFGTGMRAPEALNVLAAVAAGEAPRASRGAGRLAERMDRTPNPDVGTPSGDAARAGAPDAVAARMLASAKKARGA